MPTKRNTIMSHNKLTWYGRLSFWMGSQVILKNLKKGNWLDVLCGYNSKLQESQLHNKKIKGFHSLDFKLDPALKKKGIILKEAYLEKKIPYKENSFDNITIVNGLEHVWYAQEIVSEMYRILKPGGVLQIVVPTWAGKPILEFLAFTLKHEQAYTEMNDHKLYFDERTIWPILVKAGFKPEKIKVRGIKFGFSLHSKAIK